MAEIALDGATIAESTASNHITYKVWELTGYTPTYPIYDSEGNQTGTGGGNPIYDWVFYGNGSATISGTCKKSVTNVLIEGKSPIVKGDSTSENDATSASVYVSGKHTNATGSVTGANSNNVFANGKLISIKGSTTKTHANTNSTINGGVSTSVVIG